MDRHRKYEDNDYHSPSSRSHHSSRSSHSSRSREDHHRRERRSLDDQHSSSRRSSKDYHSDRRSSYHRSDSHKSRSSIDSLVNDTKNHDAESRKEEMGESSPNSPALDASQMLPCQPYFVEDLREKYDNNANNEIANQREEKPDEENSISSFLNKLADRAINAQKNLNIEENRSRRNSNSSKEKSSSSKEKKSTHHEVKSSSSCKEKDNSKEDTHSLKENNHSDSTKEKTHSPNNEKSSSRQLTWEEMKKEKSKDIKSKETTRLDIHRSGREVQSDNKSHISKETSELEAKVEQTKFEIDENAQLLQLQLFQYQQSNAFLAENINTLTKLNQQQLVSAPSLVSPSTSISKSLHNTPSPMSSFKSPDVFKFAPTIESNIQTNKEASSVVSQQLNNTSTEEKIKSKPKYQEFINKLEKSVGKFSSEQLKIKFKKYHKKLSPDEIIRLKKLIHNVEKLEMKKGGLSKPTKPPNKQSESKPIDVLACLPEPLKELPSLKSPLSKDVSKEPVSDPRTQKDDIPKDYMTLPEDSRKHTPHFIPRGITIQSFSPTKEKEQSNSNIEDIYKSSLPKSQINDTSNSKCSVSPLPPPPPPPVFLPPPPPLPSLAKELVKSSKENVEAKKLSFRDYQKRKGQVSNEDASMEDEYLSFLESINSEPNHSKIIESKSTTNNLLKNSDAANATEIQLDDTRERTKQSLELNSSSPALSKTVSSNPEYHLMEAAITQPKLKVLSPKSDVQTAKSSFTQHQSLSPQILHTSTKPLLSLPKPPVSSSKLSCSSPKPSVSSQKFPLSSPKMSSLKMQLSQQTSLLPSQFSSSSASPVDSSNKPAVISPEPSVSSAVSMATARTPSPKTSVASSPIVTSRNNSKKSSEPIEKVRKGFLCGECGKSFPNFVDLEIHVNQKHTNIKTINKIDVNPHNSIKVNKKIPNAPKKPTVVFTKIQANENRNPDKIKVLYPKKIHDLAIEHPNKLAKITEPKGQGKKDKKNENHEPTRIKAKKLSDSQIKEQLARIRELRDNEQKRPENKIDTNSRSSSENKIKKSSKKLDKKELDRLAELKRMKKKIRRQKERALKEKLKKQQIKEKESKNSARNKVDDIEEDVKNVDNGIGDQNKENQDTTLASQDEEPTIVTGKRQSKQTLKKKAFMEALKARQSRRKKIIEFTKKDQESKVKVVKTSGMIKAKEVILKSKKVKRGMQNEIVQTQTNTEEENEEEKPDVEANKSNTPVLPAVAADPRKRIPLHQQIESVFKSSKNAAHNSKPVIEKATKDETKDKAKGSDQVSFENTLLSEEALENIFNRVQSTKVNKLANAEGSPDMSTKKVSTTRKPSVSDDGDSSTKIMKKKIDRAERAARILIRNQRKNEDKKSTRFSDDSQIVQVEQIEPLKVKLHFKMADFVSEATALVDPKGYNETDKQEKEEKEVSKDENVEEENDKSKKTSRNKNKRRKGGSTTRKRSSRTNSVAGNNDKAPQQQQPRRRRSKYYVYEDELYAANDKPSFNEPIHVPSIFTRSVTAKGNFDNDVVLPGNVDFDMDFDYEKQKEEVYLTTDDILASLMTLSDSCVNDEVVQEMEAACDRMIVVSVRTMLDEMVDHISYIDDSSDEMVVKNVIDKLLMDISLNEDATSNRVEYDVETAKNDENEEDLPSLIASESTQSETSHLKHPFEQDETPDEVELSPQETLISDAVSDQHLENRNQESEVQALLEFILQSVEESEMVKRCEINPVDELDKNFLKEDNKNNVVENEKIDTVQIDQLHSDISQTDVEVDRSKVGAVDPVEYQEENGSSTDGKRHPSEPSELLSEIPAKQAKMNDNSFESLKQKETRSKRRNRLSRQKNAFFISELSVKEEPYDDSTEVDVQVMDEDNSLCYSFKTDLQTLNTRHPETLIDDPTSELEFLKPHEMEPLKIYSCDRNLVLPDEQAKLDSMPNPTLLESRSGTPETFTSSEAPSINFSTPIQNFYECSVCDLFFKSEEAFHFHNIHQHQPNGEATFSCQFCRQSFVSKKHLSRHLAFKHGVSYGDNNRSNKCFVCGLTFLKRFYLKSHMKRHHKNVRVHRCNHCGVSFDCQLLLYKHKTKTHLK